MRDLHELLAWAAQTDAELYVVQRGNTIEADREETRAKFQEYFATSGMRAWYSVPLADDQGRLGVLAFESRDPDFLSDAHFEFIKVVAGQATAPEVYRRAWRLQEVLGKTPSLGFQFTGP